jgi:hypothetical protein
LDLKATPDEIFEALRAMKLSVSQKANLVIDAGTVQFRRDTTQSAWKVSAPDGFDSKRLQRELARAKSLAEARRLGYRVVREERQGERIVLRLAVR